MTIGIEKVDTHEGVTMKVLLDSGATRMFANRKFVEKNRFKLEKLNRAVKIRNIDGMENSGGIVTHEIECNVYFKGHVERMRLDVCNLGRMEVILGIPWLAAHNPEIDWEKGEVKITRCQVLNSGDLGKGQHGRYWRKRGPFKRPTGTLERQYARGGVGS